MVEYGQYPLILQKDNVNGQLVPVGLAETSALTFQSLSAVTISATNYANLPTFGGNFTGIQNVCAVGVCGTSPIQSITGGNTLNLRNLYFNLGNFVSVTPGADITISYNQPLQALYGGTASTGGNDTEIPYWNASNQLITDPGNFTYDGTYLTAPKIDTPTGYYLAGNLLDIGDLATVDLTTPPTNNQLLSFDELAGKWVARDESVLASLPTDACAVIFNDIAGNPDGDPGFTFYNNIIRVPTAVINNSVCCPIFVENGTSLSTKYQGKNATLDALSITPAANQLLYFTSPTVAAATTITPNARGLLDDINYSDMRTTLGLSALATKNAVALNSADVCNTLPVANGGTNLTSLTTNGILYANGTTSFSQIAAPTGSDKSLKWDGAAFAWAVIPTGTFVSPTDPCAIVFVNTAGNNIESDPDLIFDKSTNTLGAGNLNVVGTTNVGGNIYGANLQGAIILATNAIYEGGILSQNLLSNKYQGKDPTLTTLASIDTAADVMLYFSAVDAAASATITSQARQLLDDSSFTTMRTTLGLSALATKNAVALNSADVCNTLPVTNGGTGKTTLTSNSILYGNGAGSISEVAAPTTNNTFLKWNSGFSWAANSEQWTHIFKTTTEKFTTTSYVSDSQLSVPTNSGSNYIIKYNIYFSANTVNTIYAQVDLTSTYDSFTYRINYIPPGTIVDSKVKAGSSDAFNYQGSVASNGVGYLELDCVIYNVKENVPIQFKIDSGGNDELHILKGSHLKYTTIS